MHPDCSLEKQQICWSTSYGQLKNVNSSFQLLSYPDLSLLCTISNFFNDAFHTIFYFFFKKWHSNTSLLMSPLLEIYAHTLHTEFVDVISSCYKMNGLRVRLKPQTSINQSARFCPNLPRLARPSPAGRGSYIHHMVSQQIPWVQFL